MMSAMGEFYMRACELAGLDLDSEASLDRVAAAMDAVHEDSAYHSTVEALLLAVVAILKDGRQ